MNRRSPRTHGSGWWQCGHTVALILVASFVCLAVFSDARLVRLSELSGDYPYGLSPDDLIRCARMTGQTVQTVGAADGGVRLYENATLGWRVRIPQSGQIPISLVGRGTPAGNVYPYVSLKVDRHFSQGVFVTSDAWGAFRLLVPLSKGTHDLELSFINDESVYPEDRDLDLRACSIGGSATCYRWRAPCVIRPDRMSVQVYAEPRDGGMRLANHGELADDVYFGRAGSYPVRIVVSRPNPGTREVRLQVALDEHEVTNVVVGAAESQSCVARFAAQEGVHRLRVLNRSPGRRQPVEADLAIVRIEVGDSGEGPPVARLPLRLADAPASLSAADFDVHSGGTRQDGAWVFWSNGFMRKELWCAGEGRWTVRVSARGDLCEGEGPRLLVMLDRDQAASFAVRGGEFRDYEATVNLEAGRHEIACVFDNDRKARAGEDRNLYLRGVTLTPHGRGGP